MSTPGHLIERDGAVWLSVKAQPRAKVDEIVGWMGPELKIRVSAPPVDSAANEALVSLLADVLKCPRRAIQITRGTSATHKLFRIEGMSAGLALERIQGAMAQA